MTPWTGDQAVARPLSTHRITQTHNKRIQTSMPWVGFEITIPAFEPARTVHALDSAASVIGSFLLHHSIYCSWWNLFALHPAEVVPLRVVASLCTDFTVPLRVVASLCTDFTVPLRVVASLCTDFTVPVYVVDTVRTWCFCEAYRCFGPEVRCMTARLFTSLRFHVYILRNETVFV
jgi:hypothetical protein